MIWVRPHNGDHSLSKIPNKEILRIIGNHRQDASNMFIMINKNERIDLK